MNVADDLGLQLDPSERHHFRSWMAPLLRADIPRRKAPSLDLEDRALARLEGVEVDQHAHWLRGAIVASITSVPCGVCRGGRALEWRRRALTVFAFREPEEEALPWRRVRSRALQALRWENGLQLPLNLHAALRFAPAELQLGTLRELSELALALDGSLDSLVLQSACDWLSGDSEIAWSRLQQADGFGGPAHRPEATERWSACLHAFLREEEGDLIGALEALDRAPVQASSRADFTILRIGIATFTQDAARIEREIESLSTSRAHEPARGELAAALFPRIQRWRRLRPTADSSAHLPLRVRHALCALRDASSHAPDGAAYGLATQLLGESE
jgi:hypothetical protein